MGVGITNPNHQNDPPLDMIQLIVISTVLYSMRTIYSKGNLLIRKFKHCTPTVKCQLFQSFCTDMYCSQLWGKYKQSMLQQLSVAYNNVFRYLLSIKRQCSISQCFIKHGIYSFNVLCRKLVYSFYNRVSTSDNTLVRNMAGSLYFIYASPLHKRWQSSLYTF